MNHHSKFSGVFALIVPLVLSTSRRTTLVLRGGRFAGKHNYLSQEVSTPPIFFRQHPRSSSKSNRRQQHLVIQLSVQPVQSHRGGAAYTLLFHNVSRPPKVPPVQSSPVTLLFAPVIPLQVRLDQARTRYI
ncbi:hypothetical protein QCA50_007119 [Cerrena zonata]